ncbi:HAMP domain-containing sensor histidine kinase [Candidatus Kapabacteria bacterium]|nr:HAMP domain-containing sensor histidine kinase [Candidatus Kapabacteria bacterium]
MTFKNELERVSFDGKNELELFLNAYLYHKNSHDIIASKLLDSINYNEWVLLKNPIIKHHIFEYLGNIYGISNQANKSYYFYKQIFDNYLNIKSDNIRHRNLTFNNYLVSAQLTGNIENALYQVDSLTNTLNLELTHEHYLMMSVEFRLIGDFKKSMDYSQGLFEYRLKDDYFEYFEYYSNVFLIFFEMKEYEFAEAELFKSEKHIGSKLQEAEYKYYKAILSFARKRNMKAKTLFFEALSYSEYFHPSLSEISKANIYNKIAEIYLETDSLNLCNKYLDSALNQFQESYKPMTYATYSNLFLKTNQLDSAYKYIKLFSEYTNTLNSKIHILKSLELNYLFYEKTGNLDSSIAYMKKFLKVHSKLNNWNKKSKFAEIRDSFEGKLLRAEKIIQRDKNLLRFATLIIILLLSLATLGYFINLYITKSKKEKRVIFENTNLDAENKELIQLNNEILSNQKALTDFSDVQENMLKILIHDLNTPLSSIALSAKTLLSYNDKLAQKEKESIIKRIEELSDYSTKLISDQNNWVKQTSDKLSYNPEYIDIVDFTLNVIKHHKLNSIQKSIAITANIDEVIVRTDKFMLEIIIRNLVSNSIKYTPKNGKIKIYTKVVNNQLTYTISDNGKGIPKETMNNLNNNQKIISRLGTFNESGMGIGLTICKDFVSRIGSTFEINSNKRNGTKVSFNLKVEDI